MNLTDIRKYKNCSLDFCSKDILSEIEDIISGQQDKTKAVLILLNDDKTYEFTYYNYGLSSEQLITLLGQAKRYEESELIGLPD